MKKLLVCVVLALLCSCGATDVVVDELAVEVEQLGDTVTQHGVMLDNLCLKLDVDTTAVKQPDSVPADKPAEEDTNWMSFIGLAGLLGLLKRGAKDPRVQEAVKNAAKKVIKEKLG